MSLRILVVEDEPEIADFVVRGLREEGFAVEHAADGDDASHAAGGSEWGVSSCSTGGSRAGTGWTCSASSGRRAAARRPCSPDGPRCRVRPGAGSTPGPMITFASRSRSRSCWPGSAPWVVAASGPPPRRSWSGATSASTSRPSGRPAPGRPVELTAKEQALLVFFLRHPGEVLSRTRIYEHVWDERYDGLSNTLEVHVMELRRKLEVHGPRVIQTLRGRGYVLDPPPAGGPTP